MQTVKVLMFSLLLFTVGSAHAITDGIVPEENIVKKDKGILEFEHNAFSLEIKNTTGFTAVLKIYNLDGMLVAKTVTAENEFILALNEFEVGNYYVSILSENGIHKGGKIKISSHHQLASE